MSDIQRRVKKLEDGAGGGEPFTFVLERRSPKGYRGNDGKLYSAAAITKRLESVPDLRLTVGEGWGIPEEPEPDTLYLDWGDDDEH